jgi:hypothetical protein
MDTASKQYTNHDADINPNMDTRTAHRDAIFLGHANGNRYADQYAHKHTRFHSNANTDSNPSKRNNRAYTPHQYAAAPNRRADHCDPESANQHIVPDDHCDAFVHANPDAARYQYTKTNAAAANQYRDASAAYANAVGDTNAATAANGYLHIIADLPATHSDHHADDPNVYTGAANNYTVPTAAHSDADI